MNTIEPTLPAADARNQARRVANQDSGNLANAAWMVIVLVLVALAFAPGLSGDFIFDDFSNIVFNSRIHADSITLESLVRAAGAYSGPIGRPLATVGFAIDHAIGGPDPFAFKVHSLLVHCMNSLLACLLLQRLFALAHPQGRGYWWVPLVVAAAWAVHPIQVSTVLYVVQRMEMLSATFMLAGMLTYLEARQAQLAGQRSWPKMAAALVIPSLGLLAKESSALFPLYYFALEFAIFRFDARSPATRRTLRAAFALAIAGSLVVFLAIVLPRFGSAEGYAIRDFTMEERVLTQLRVLPMYIGQILAPVPSSMPFYYDDLSKSTGLLSPPTTALGLLLIAALFTAAVWARRRLPLFSFGVLLFFSAHALTSSPINLELAFEHRNYLASLGILIAVAAVANSLRIRSSERTTRYLAIAATVMLALICAIRSATWGDPLLLAMELVSLNPESSRASNDLGATYVRYAGENPDSPFLDLAIAEFERGSALGGQSALAEQGLILTAAMAERPAKPEWWDALDEKVRNQPLGPELHMAVTGLLAQHKKGFRVDVDRMARSYQALLDRKPDWPGYMYATFAQFVLDDLEDPRRAKELFVRSITADPDDEAFAHQVLASVVRGDNTDITEAVVHAMRERGLLDSSPIEPADAN